MLEEDHLAAGTLLDGRYRVLSLIGQGGQARVYLARNERTGRECAIKELRGDAADPDLARRGFLAELELLRRLAHPCLPEIYDVVYLSPRAMPLIVMERIGGHSLHDELLINGPCPSDKVALWGASLCDVLELLHGQDEPLIYRDLKPGNIMLSDDGEIRLIDFGTVCGVSSGGVSMGTKRFAAPEQLEGGGKVDERADIYSLGVTLYCLLTGKTPKNSLSDGLVPSLKGRRLSPSLCEVIKKCTRRRPVDRYQSARALRQDLLSCGARDQLKSLKSLGIRVGIFTGIAACLLTAASMGFVERSRAAAAAAEREDNSEALFYLDLAERIRDYTPELLEAGLEEKELQEILAYILVELEEAYY